MRFRELHKDWEAYNSQHYDLKSISIGEQNAIHGLIVKYVDRDAHLLAQVVNRLFQAIPSAPTTNFGYGWLINDLEDALRLLCRARFDRTMDGLSDIASLLGPQYSDEVNEVLGELNFGWVLELSSDGWEWYLRDEMPIATVAEVEEAAVTVESVCRSAHEHLEQLKHNLKRGTERGYKDAVRDAMTSMEALLKQISGTNDIKDATAALRSSGKWGPDLIVKDGLSIWNHLHQLHPDIRHGAPSSTVMPVAEAIYWIERMLVVIKYMSKMAS